MNRENKKRARRERRKNREEEKECSHSLKCVHAQTFYPQAV